MQLARVLDQDDAVAGLGDLGEQRIDQRRLAGRGAAGDQNVLPLQDGYAQEFGLTVRHDAGGDIIIEREDRDRRSPNGKARRRYHGRHQPLEPLPAFRQFRRDARMTGMDLDPDMMGDEANNPFGIGRCRAAAGIFKAAGQAIDPEAAVRVQHHLDDAGVFEKAGNRRAECGAQHPSAAQESLGSGGNWHSMTPRVSPLRDGCNRRG